jgi:LacI family transcriptional regulator
MKKNLLPTLESIAKELNLSVSTVSRVLNGKSEKYRISKKTIELVLEKAKEFHYQPNQLARSLRLNRSHTIGLIIPDISNPFFAMIAKYIERSARENGYSVIVSDSDENTEIEKSSLQFLASRKIDGLIISPVGKEAEHLIKLSNKNIPIVLVDRYFRDLKLPFVGSDNFKGSFEATNYLIQNGHSRIAFIQGIKNTTVNQDRVNGFIEAFKINNIPLDRRLIVGDSFGIENGYTETRLLITLEKRPTALFAASNLISLGVLKALYEENLNVPDDISLISFDDLPYSDYLTTPLTTVAQQSKDIGSIAFKLLMDIMESDKATELSKILLKTKLILRKSVKTINLRKEVV